MLPSRNGEISEMLRDFTPPAQFPIVERYPQCYLLSKRSENGNQDPRIRYDLIARIGDKIINEENIKFLYNGIKEKLDYDYLKRCIIELSELCLVAQKLHIKIINTEIGYETYVLNEDEENFNFDSVMQIKYVIKIRYDEERLPDMEVDNLQILRTTLKFLKILKDVYPPPEHFRDIGAFFNIFNGVTANTNIQSLVRHEFSKSDMFKLFSPYLSFRQERRASTKTLPPKQMIEKLTGCIIRTELANQQLPSMHEYFLDPENDIITFSCLNQSRPTVTLKYALPNQLKQISLEHNLKFQDIPEDTLFSDFINTVQQCHEVSWKTVYKNQALFSSKSVRDDGDFRAGDLVMVIRQLITVSKFYMANFAEALKPKGFMTKQQFARNLAQQVNSVPTSMEKIIDFNWRAIFNDL